MYDNNVKYLTPYYKVFRGSQASYPQLNMVFARKMIASKNGAPKKPLDKTFGSILKICQF